MNTESKFPGEVVAAVAKVMQGVKTLGKSEKNKYDNYDFVSVDKFFAAVGPLMADAGLVAFASETEHEFYENKKGSLWMRVGFDIWLAHSSGQAAGPFHRKVSVPMNGAQSHGSAQSYVVKQFIRAQFLVPTGDKDDADQNAKDEHQAAPQLPSSKKLNPFDARDWLLKNLESIEDAKLQEWFAKRADAINKLAAADNDAAAAVRAAWDARFAKAFPAESTPFDEGSD